MSMSIRLAQSADLIDWLNEQLGEPSFPATRRNKLSGTCFSLAQHHQRALVSLIQNEIPLSAAALLRILWEAYIRGVWLLRCASDSQLDDFTHDRSGISFRCMIDNIESLPGYANGVLSSAKTANWNAFNSYTHTGFYAVERHLKGSSIEPNMSLEEIYEILGFGDAVGLLVAFEFACLASNEALVKTLLAKAKDISIGTPHQ